MLLKLNDNNFVRINERIGRFTNSGLLLLEDGIGTSNAQYVGTVSLEGSFKFETNTTFNNQNLRVIKQIFFNFNK